MSRRNDNHTIRRIVLPSGRSIEVLRFDEGAPTVRRLHVCPDCACELVQPYDWTETDSSSWQLTLECPNCAWLETGVFSQAEVESLEEQLDDGVAEMIDDLQRLTRANMTADVEAFIGALRTDLILPEDF